MNKNVLYDEILHSKKEKSLTLPELEIMSIFTSPKWSTKTYLRPNSNINMVEKKEIQSSEKLINIESYETEKEKISNFHPKNIFQEKYPISENKNISKKSNDSFQLLLRKKKNIQNNIKSSNENRNKTNEFSEVNSSTNNRSKNVSTKTLKSKKKTRSGSKLISNEDFSIETFVSIDKMMKKIDEDRNDTVSLTNSNADRMFSETQETSEKRESTFTSLLSSKGSYCYKTKINNDLDDINYSCYSETTDSSSKWSLNTSIMIRDIVNQAQLCDLATERQTEELANDEAVEMIMKKAKMSLGKFLVEGLYEVSRNYRHDPFTSLGIWLLIQADIRDEHNIRQGSYDSNEDFSMTKNVCSEIVLQ